MLNIIKELLSEFEKFCENELESCNDTCGDCKYADRIGDGTRFECFKEYCKDKGII